MRKLKTAKQLMTTALLTPYAGQSGKCAKGSLANAVTGGKRLTPLSVRVPCCTNSWEYRQNIYLLVTFQTAPKFWQ